MSSIDLVKKLETTKVTDIQSRFATTEDFLNSTSNNTTNKNVVTFAEVGEIVQKELPTSSTPIEKDNELLNSIPKDTKQVLEEVSGTEISSSDDLHKAINDLNNQVKQKLIHINQFFSRFNDAEYLTEVVFRSSNTSPFSNNVSTQIKSNQFSQSNQYSQSNQSNQLLSFDDQKLQSSLNQISSNIPDNINSNNFGNIVQTLDINEESKFMTSLKNTPSLIKNSLKNIDLDMINNTVNNFYNNTIDLVSLSSDVVNSFISDVTSSEYFSDIIPLDTFNKIKSSIEKVLKYATTTCDNLISLVRTAIFSINEIINNLSDLLHISIELKLPQFFTDLINCFDKIQEVINDVQTTQNLIKKTETIGATVNLKVISDNKPKHYWLPEISIYNTAKNDNNLLENKDIFHQLISDNEVDSSKFISYHHDELNVNGSINMESIRYNSQLSSIILENEDKESSRNFNFLNSIPLAKL